MFAQKTEQVIATPNTQLSGSWESLDSLESFSQTPMPTQEELNNDLALALEKLQVEKRESKLAAKAAKSARKEKKSKKMKFQVREVPRTHSPKWNQDLSDAKYAIYSVYPKLTEKVRSLNITRENWFIIHNDEVTTDYVCAYWIVVMNKMKAEGNLIGSKFDDITTDYKIVKRTVDGSLPDPKDENFKEIIKGWDYSTMPSLKGEFTLDISILMYWWSWNTVKCGSYEQGFLELMDTLFDAETFDVNPCTIVPMRISYICLKSLLYIMRMIEIHGYDTKFHPKLRDIGKIGRREVDIDDIKKAITIKNRVILGRVNLKEFTKCNIVHDYILMERAVVSVYKAMNITFRVPRYATRLSADRPVTMTSILRNIVGLCYPVRYTLENVVFTNDEIYYPEEGGEHKDPKTEETVSHVMGLGSKILLKLTTKILEDIKVSIKQTLNGSTELIKGLIESLFSSVKPFLDPVVAFMQPIIEQIKGFVYDMFIKMGFYPENIPKITITDVIIAVASFIAFRMTDNFIIKAAIFGYICVRYKVIEKITLAWSKIKDLWAGEEEHEEEIPCSFEFADLGDMFCGSTESILAKLLCTIVLCSTGYAATAGDKKGVTTILMTTLRNVHFATAGLTGIIKLFEIMPKIVTNVMSFFKGKTDEQKMDDMSHDLYRRGMKFIAIVEAINADHGIYALKRSPKLQQRIADMQKECSQLKILLSSKISKNLDLSFKYQLREAFKSYKTLRNVVYRICHFSGFRYTPFHVQFYGAAGIGKSSMMSLLTQHIRDKYYPHESTNSVVWSRSQGDYFDGYCGQPIVVVDDIWKIADPKVVTEIISLVSNTPLPVPMAHLEDKGTTFTSDWILSTTNIAYPVVKDVFCSEAVHRRRHLLVEVECDKRVIDPATHKFDIQLFEKFYPAVKELEMRTTLPHLKFNILKPVRDGSKYEECTTEGAYFKEGETLPKGLTRPLVGLSYLDLITKMDQRRNAMRAEEAMIRDTTGIVSETELDRDLVEIEILAETVGQKELGPLYELLDTKNIDPNAANVDPKVAEEIDANIEKLLDDIEADVDGNKVFNIVEKESELDELFNQNASTSKEEACNDEFYDAKEFDDDQEFDEFCRNHPRMNRDQAVRGYRAYLKRMQRETDRRNEILNKRGREIKNNTQIIVSKTKLINDEPAILKGDGSYMDNYNALVVPMLNGTMFNGFTMIKTQSMINKGMCLAANDEQLENLKLDFLDFVDRVDHDHIYFKKDKVNKMANRLRFIVGPECLNVDGAYIGPDDLLVCSLSVEFREMVDTFESFSTATQTEILESSRGFINSMSIILNIRRSYKSYRDTILAKLKDRVFRTLGFFINTFAQYLPMLFLGCYLFALYKINRYLANLMRPEETSRIMFKSRKPGYLGKKRTAVGEPCDMKREALDQYLPKIRRNVVNCTFRLGDNKISTFNGIGFDGHFLLINLHSLTSILEKYEEAKYEVGEKEATKIPFRLGIQLTNRNDESWDFYFNYNDIYIIPENDAAVLFCPHMPAFSKISKYFVTNKTIDSYNFPADAKFVYTMNDKYVEEEFNGFSYYRGINYASNAMGVDYVRNVMEFDGDPPKGSSGGPLLACIEKTKSCIWGILSNKSKGRARFSVVTREELEKAMEKFKDRNVVHNEPDVCDKITTNAELIDTHLRVVGSVPQEKVLGIVGKTKFRRSLISEGFWSQRIPAILSAFDERVPFNDHPLRHSINKHGRDVMEPFHPDYTEMAINWATEYFLSVLGGQTIEIFDLETSIKGRTGEHMNIKTSPGIPWIYNKMKPGKKTWFEIDEDGDVVINSDDLIEEVEKLQESLSKREVPALMMYEFPKDELRPIKKALGPPIKTRSISVLPMHLSIVHRKCHLDLYEKLQAKADGTTMFCVGIDPSGVAWSNMYRSLRQVGTKGFDFDVSNWDGHFTGQLMWMVKRVIINILTESNAFKDEQDKIYWTNVIESIGDQAINGYDQFLDVVYQKLRGMPSGYAGTAPENTIGHIILAIKFYIMICEKMDLPEYMTLQHFLRNCAVRVYGDDIIYVLSDELISEGITPGHFAKLYEHFGWPITSASKDGDVNELKEIGKLQFLKRWFEPHPIYGNVRMFAKIELSVVDDLLYWIRNQDDLVEQQALNIIDALEFLVPHGRLIYNDYRDRILISLNKIGLVLPVPTYTSMSAMLDKRFFKI